MPTPLLNLAGFTFEELFQHNGLSRLDQQFLNSIPHDLRARLLAYRSEMQPLTPLEISELLIECAKLLENFLIQFFNIEEAAAITQIKTLSENPVSVFKQYFVLRRAKKNLLKKDSLASFAELDAWLMSELKKAPLQTDDKELAVALLGNQYISQPEHFSHEINQLTDWCVRALTSPEGKSCIANWTSFKIPERLDYENLVKCELLSEDEFQRMAGADTKLRLRDGFTLTDPRMNTREIQDEVNYCIYCQI